MAPFSNRDVTNTDRSIHYIAVILDKYSGVGKFGISTDRCKIEKAVKDSACGNCREARYFLKDTSVNATTIQGQPKDSLKKFRCCIVKKEIIKTDILLRIYRGTYTDDSYCCQFKHCVIRSHWFPWFRTCS